jgi:porin
MESRTKERQRIPGIALLAMASLLGAASYSATVCTAVDDLREQAWIQAVTPRFGLTQIYQQNVHGGTSTASRSGRYAGSHALEAEIDLESLAGVDGAGFYVLIEGGWPDAGGIDPAAVGSYFGVNADAIEGEWGELSELWFQQAFANGCLLGRVGKLDLTGAFQCRGCDTSFDGSKYANDETGQFLNGALVNNPTISFPDLTFGAALFASPRERWHLGCAVAMGNDEDTSWGSADQGVFAIAEASFVPEQRCFGGNATAQYRAGLWYHTDGARESDCEEQRGAYLSVSQPVWPANGRTDGDGGLGLFARAGWADGPGTELADFWSLGLQYQGLWSDDDVLGLGMGRGTFAHATEPSAPTGSETVWELYYNTPITSQIAVSPNIQYAADPGGYTGGRDALVAGLRFQITLE